MSRSLKSTITLLLLCALLAVFIPAYLSLGEQSYGWQQTWLALFNQAGSTENLMIHTLRAPRLLLAIIAGSALALAGFLLQNLTRVSLASPSLLGAVDGAAVGVLVFLTLFTAADNQVLVSIVWLPLAAFIGAISSFMVVYWLTLRTNPSISRFILVGITISGLLKAITVLLMIVGPIYLASQAQLWLTGYINQTNWQEIQILAPIYLLLLLLSFLTAPWLALNQLDNSLAKALGLPQFSPYFIMILAAALTAVAVSFAGALGFVGLLVPHISKRLIRAGLFKQMLACCLLGAILLLLADFIGRTVFFPYEVPAGVITALLGVPLFIYLFSTARSQA